MPFTTVRDHTDAERLECQALLLEGELRQVGTYPLALVAHLAELVKVRLLLVNAML